MVYLLHAYYREKRIEYRYFEQKGKRRVFDKTKFGADQYWDLERCLNFEKSPVDAVSTSTLRFLIGLRHEIEHQMTTRIDDLLSGRFQACCLNYNTHLKQLFGEELGIEKHLSFSLQFSSLSEKQIENLKEYKDLPENISTFINDFDQAIPETNFNYSKYSYRVLFVSNTANRKGQADRVIEFIKPDSEIAKGINKEYVVIKEKERQNICPVIFGKRCRKEDLKDLAVTNILSCEKQKMQKTYQRVLVYKLQKLGIGTILGLLLCKTTVRAIRHYINNIRLLLLDRFITSFISCTNPSTFAVLSFNQIYQYKNNSS